MIVYFALSVDVIMLSYRHFSGAGTCLASFGGSRALSLSSVCGGELGSGVVRVLNIFTQECSDKTQQVCHSDFYCMSSTFLFLRLYSLIFSLYH